MNQITVEQVRLDTRSDESLTDADVQKLIDDAGGIVSDYLKRDAFQDDEPVKSNVLSAIRLVAVVLYQSPDGSVDPLSPSVKNILARARDPALA